MFQIPVQEEPREVGLFPFHSSRFLSVNKFQGWRQKRQI